MGFGSMLGEFKVVKYKVIYLPTFRKCHKLLYKKLRVNLILLFFKCRNITLQVISNYIIISINKLIYHNFLKNFI